MRLTCLVGLALISAGCSSADRPWIIFVRDTTDFVTSVRACAPDSEGGACKALDGNIFPDADSSKRKILGLQLAPERTALAIQIQSNTRPCDRLSLDLTKTGDEITVGMNDGTARPTATCEANGCSWSDCE